MQTKDRDKPAKPSSEPFRMTTGRGAGGSADRRKPDEAGTKGEPADRRRWVYYAFTGLLILILLGCVILFFRYDESHRLSSFIQALGFWGILMAIAIMALFSLLPVPTEFFMVILMEIYGAWAGMLYSWIGTLISATITFLIARYFGRALLKKFISERRLKMVSEWVADRGVLGLLLARIVPLPFIVVNYTAGISPSVKLVNYLWTSAVGGIPYYVGSALVFLGVSKRYFTWLVVGGVIVLAIWVAGYWNNKHVNWLKRGMH